MTGGRLKRVRDSVSDASFFMTYGDELADVNIRELVDFHAHHRTLATVFGAQTAARRRALPDRIHPAPCALRRGPRLVRHRVERR